MSYINVSVTHAYGAGGIVMPRTNTLDVGFSREGGRLDHLATSTQVAGPFAPIVVEWDPHNDSLQAASRPLLGAITTADGVRNVRVDHGDGGQPDMVTWSDRFGTTLGSSLSTAAPESVRSILEGARLLETAMRDAASGATPAA